MASAASFLCFEKEAYALSSDRETSETGTESVVVLEGPLYGDEIDLDISYGYQNVAKSGEYLPIEVDIENQTDQDISGILYIDIENESNIDISYDYNINIERNSHKKFQSTINVPDETDHIRLRLCDREGKLLSEQSSDITIHGEGAELLIGLLSNKPDSLAYFRGVNLGSSGLQTRTVTLNPGSLPDTREGLEQLDIIVISDLNMQRLGAELTSAIYQWVRDGGVLLMGMGVNSDPLGELSQYLGEMELSSPELREVNMGIQYSQTGPDGAVLELMTRELYAEDGIQAMQSGSLAMLTNISAGSGVIGITAFSLCDIEDFCYEHLEYVEDMLEALLGSSRIRSLGQVSGEMDSKWRQLKSMVDIADSERFPELILYPFMALIYVLVCGPGLHHYLKKRGLTVYYPFGIIICSFSAALVVWLMGVGLRFGGVFADHASIVHMDEEGRTETSFIKLSSPDREELELEIPEGMLLLPVLPSSSDEPAGYLRDPERGLSISISGASESEEASGVGRLSVMPDEAFSEAYLEMSTVSELREGERLQIELGYYDDRLSGSLKNDTGRDLYDVCILLFGRIISVGDLPAGESVELEGLRTVYGPAGSSVFSASYIVGPEDGGRDESRSSRQKRMALLSYYMEEMPLYYDRGAELIGFCDGGGLAESLLTDNDIENEGLTIVTASVEADMQDQYGSSRSVITGEPRVISGSYDAASNTISGTAATVLEYSLGTDLSLSSVRFNALSPEFAGLCDEEGMELQPFTGAVSIYNYVTGSYDIMDEGELSFSRNDIEPYLSPENAVMVRYIPDENVNEGTLMFLPVPSVTGVG